MSEEDAGQIRAAEGSMLAGLRARREQAEKKLYLDLAVPRLDPPVYVRYRAMKQREVDVANSAAQKSTDPDRFVVANAAVLAHACVGVFEIVGGEERSIASDASSNAEDWPRFDETLAKLLGLPAESQPAAIVRGLYLTDGDLQAASNELAIWSGQAIRRTQEDIEGN